MRLSRSHMLSSSLQSQTMQTMIMRSRYKKRHQRENLKKISKKNSANILKMVCPKMKRKNLRSMLENRKNRKRKARLHRFQESSRRTMMINQNKEMISSSKLSFENTTMQPSARRMVKSLLSIKKMAAQIIKTNIFQRSQQICLFTSVFNYQSTSSGSTFMEGQMRSSLCRKLRALIWKSRG